MTAPWRQLGRLRPRTEFPSEGPVYRGSVRWRNGAAAPSAGAHTQPMRVLEGVTGNCTAGEACLPRDVPKGALESSYRHHVRTFLPVNDREPSRTSQNLPEPPRIFQNLAEPSRTFQNSPLEG